MVGKQSELMESRELQWYTLRTGIIGFTRSNWIHFLEMCILSNFLYRNLKYRTQHVSKFNFFLQKRLMMSIFDPLGFLSPFSIQERFIFQDICKKRYKMGQTYK